MLTCYDCGKEFPTNHNVSNKRITHPKSVKCFECEKTWRKTVRYYGLCRPKYCIVPYPDVFMTAPDGSKRCLICLDVKMPNELDRFFEAKPICSTCANNLRDARKNRYLNQNVISPRV